MPTPYDLTKCQKAALIAAMTSTADPLMFDAIHADTPQAIVGPNDSLITRTQARELLSAPSGTRPRIYGLMFADSSYQIVKLTHVDKLTPAIVAQWLSGTSMADLIGRA